MINENQVIEILEKYLKKNNYIIKQKLTTSQKGFDIIAQKGVHTLYIEAKGETSSKKTSKRYTKQFTKNQVKTHIASAIFTSIKTLSHIQKNERIAIAFPDNEHHREIISQIKDVLHKIEIIIFLVKENQVEEIK